MTSVAYYRFTTPRKRQEQGVWQRERVAEYEAAHGLATDEAIVEIGSGWSDYHERPTLQELLGRIREGEVRTVLFATTDSLSTVPGLDNLLYGVRLLRNLGAAVHFATDYAGIDELEQTSMYRGLLTIFGPEDNLIVGGQRLLTTYRELPEEDREELLRLAEELRLKARGG